MQWYFENFSIDLNLYSLSIKSEEKLRTIVDMMGMEQTPFLMPDSCENNTASYLSSIGRGSNFGSSPIF